MLEEAVERTRRGLGEQHREYATALNNLALLYQEQGDLRAPALGLYQSALALLERTQGEKHADYARVLGNLAVGPLAPAPSGSSHGPSPTRRAADLRKQLQGEGHVDQVAGLTDQALLHNALGEQAEAVALARQARDLSRRVPGEKHPTHATVVNNLARAFAGQPRPRRGPAPLPPGTETPGETLAHATRAPANAHQPGRLYQVQGKFADARQACEQALTAARHHLELAAAVQSERQQLAPRLAVTPLSRSATVAFGPGRRGSLWLPPCPRMEGRILGAAARAPAVTALAHQEKDAEVQGLLAELQQTTHRLAALSLSGRPDRREVEKLARDKEDREAAARHSAALPLPDSGGFSRRASPGSARRRGPGRFPRLVASRPPPAHRPTG